MKAGALCTLYFAEYDHIPRLGRSHSYVVLYPVLWCPKRKLFYDNEAPRLLCRKYSALMCLDAVGLWFDLLSTP